MRPHLHPHTPAPADDVPDTAAPDQPTVEIDCPRLLEDREVRPLDQPEPPIGPSTGSRP